MGLKILRSGSIPTGGKLFAQIDLPSLVVRSNTKMTTLPTLCNYGKTRVSKKDAVILITC